MNRTLDSDFSLKSRAGATVEKNKELLDAVCGTRGRGWQLCLNDSFFSRKKWAGGDRLWKTVSAIWAMDDDWKRHGRRRHPNLGARYQSVDSLVSRSSDAGLFLVAHFVELRSPAPLYAGMNLPIFSDQPIDMTHCQTQTFLVSARSTDALVR